MRQLPLHPAISHLSHLEMKELIGGYKSGEKVGDLMRKFKINLSPNQLRRMLPPEKLDLYCHVCDAQMVQEVPARKANQLFVGKISCPNCGHMNSCICPCLHCIQERKRLAEEEKAKLKTKILNAILAEQLRSPNNICFLENLSLAESVAFLALTRCCPIDDQYLCGPLVSNTVPFAPTAALRNELLSKLQETGLIAVSEHSAEGSIGIVCKQIIYDTQNVRWIVPAINSHELVQNIELAGLSRFWPKHWYDDAVPLWLNVALAECRQFYDYNAKLRGLQAQGDGAVNTMLINLLRDFSVGQVYRVIWNGARDASDFLIRKNPNRAHAANYMVGACQRWADRARAEGWQVIAFKRNFDLPRSMLSYVLFDVILRIGERGFTDVVCEQNLRIN